jgi:hypothetical protein
VASKISYPLAVRKSLNHGPYCTRLQLPRSFSSCANVILYGCRCSCFQELSVLMNMRRLLIVTICEQTFPGFESCDQKCPVFFPLLTLVACRISARQQLSIFRKLVNQLQHCVAMWYVRFGKHFRKLLFGLFCVYTSTTKHVFH